jgi:glycosyltransferase involved in cell wall biosynthesis
MLTDRKEERPFVSIVIPCRNEVGHIGPCLDSILTSDYPQDRLEVVIADGMSDDGTREIIRRYVSAHSRITMIDNPKRITPCAMNLAIQAARGEVIIRMDAHAIFPADYLSRLVAAQQETGAENVGTVVVTLPADDTPVAAAIATGLSHPLGVGNSHFRVGTKVRKWVNHVPFGCWRRELFDRIGFFDEELVRDQDVEFNARLLNHGGRILLLPDMASGYHARRTMRQLARMMYQYGYFKPLVARKAGRILTVRQLVPSLFVLGVSGSLGLTPWWDAAGLALGVILLAYSVLIGVAVLRAFRPLGARGALALAGVFPTMHVSYGIGYLRGIRDHMLRPRHGRRPAVGIALSR